MQALRLTPRKDGDYQVSGGVEGNETFCEVVQVTTISEARHVSSSCVGITAKLESSPARLLDSMM